MGFFVAHTGVALVVKGAAIERSARAVSGKANVGHGAVASVVAGGAVGNGPGNARIFILIAHADIAVIGEFAAVARHADAIAIAADILDGAVQFIVAGCAVGNRRQNVAVTRRCGRIAGSGVALIVVRRAIDRRARAANAGNAFMIDGAGIRVVAVLVGAAFIANIGFVIAEFVFRTGVTRRNAAIRSVAALETVAVDAVVRAVRVVCGVFASAGDAAIDRAFHRVAAMIVDETLPAGVRFLVAELTRRTRVPAGNTAFCRVARFRTVAIIAVLRAIAVIGRINAGEVHTPVVRASYIVVALFMGKALDASVNSFIACLRAG